MIAPVAWYLFTCQTCKRTIERAIFELSELPTLAKLRQCEACQCEACQAKPSVAELGQAIATVLNNLGRSCADGS